VALDPAVKTGGKRHTPPPLSSSSYLCRRPLLHSQPNPHTQPQHQISSPPPGPQARRRRRCWRGPRKDAPTPDLRLAGLRTHATERTRGLAARSHRPGKGRGRAPPDLTRHTERAAPPGQGPERIHAAEVPHSGP